MSIYIGKFSRNMYLASLLYDSVEDNNLCAVKQLLEKGANPNIVLPNKGIAPFHLAVGGDRDFTTSIVEQILKYGGNPNVPSVDGLTPVHIAAAWGKLAILKLLLSYGGDPEAKDENNMTPVKYAHKDNLIECIELMKPFVDSSMYGEQIDLNNGFLEETSHNIAILGKPLENYKSSKVLKELPATNTTEYVMNWVDKHVETLMDDEKDIISFESSLDESDNETINKTLALTNPTFRKNYKKTRKISRCLNKTVTSSENDSSDVIKSTIPEYNQLEFLNNLEISSSLSSCELSEQTSSESGIIIPLNEEQQLSHRSIQELESDFNSVSKAEISSDYMTASNGIPGHVFELTDDWSFSILTSDKSNVSGKQQELSGIENTSSVAMSEIYKYEDKEKGIVLYERRLLKLPSECAGSESSRLSSVPDSFIYDSDTLRRELTIRGCEPGPITKTTKKLYLKKLFHLKKYPSLENKKSESIGKKVYSKELEQAWKNPENWYDRELPFSKSLEEAVVKDFSNPDPTRKWREGTNKTSFTYLLLDPRITNNLPWRYENLEKKEIWEIFLNAIFYVGKGKRSRPYSHLYDAVSIWKQEVYITPNKKLQHILDIWKCGNGVICLYFFHNIIPAEAYTREAAMISSLKLYNITNARAGDFYGVAARWSQSPNYFSGTSLAKFCWNMDDPNEENVEENWVFLNPVDDAEEALSLNSEDITDVICSGEKKEQELPSKDEGLLQVDSNDHNSKKNVESDSDSDGISIISESSHMHDNTDEEAEDNDNRTRKVVQKDKMSDVNTNFVTAESEEYISDGLTDTSCNISRPPEYCDLKDFEKSFQEISEQEEDVECVGNTSTDLEPFLESEETNIFENRTENISRQYEALWDIPVYRKYMNSFIIGTVLFLSTSIFLARYFYATDKLSAEDLARYEQYLGPDSDNFVESHDYKNFDVPTALAYCKEKHQNDGTYAYRNMNKCLRKIESRLRRKMENAIRKRQVDNMQKQLEIKENFLNEKEKYLAKKEYELNSKEAKINVRNDKPTYNLINSKETKEMDVNFAISIDSSSDFENNFQEKQTKQKKDKKMYHKKNYDKKQKKPKNKLKNSHHDDHSEDKNDHSQEDSKYNKYDENKCKYKYDDCKLNNVKYKKDDYKSRELKYESDCKDENACKKYKKYRNEYDSFEDDDDDDEEKEKKQKKLKEYASKQKSKYKASNEKYQKEKKWKSKDKQNQFYYEKSNYKYDNSCKEDRKDRKYETGTNYVLIDNKNDTNTITGYWVGKLYKARNDLRNKETSGEWYFDRASYRKRKRDKARWYFDWMFDREFMRYKRSVYTDV